MKDDEKQSGDEGVLMVCRVCMQTFTTQAELDAHVNDVHADEDDAAANRSVGSEGPQRPRFKR